MKLNDLVKNGMVICGILAALIILLSPTVQRETSQFLATASAADEKPIDGEKQLIVSPDAVTSTSQGAVENVNPFVVQEIIIDEENHSVRPLAAAAPLASFFKSFLRTVISPQAP